MLDVETLPCTHPPVVGGTHELTPMRSGNGSVPACRYCGFTETQLAQTRLMLTTRDHMALQLAGQRYKYEAVRYDAAREQLGLSPGQYWQVVGVLLERPEAEAAYPTLVRRLRRLRDARAGVRGRRASTT